MSAVVRMIQGGIKPPCHNGSSQNDSAKMAVVKWTPCQNDRVGVEPPCQNGTAPGWGETPHWRK